MGQGTPPLLAGVVTVLDRVCIPVGQLLEQSSDLQSIAPVQFDQLDHSLTTQFTGHGARVHTFSL